MRETHTRPWYKTYVLSGKSNTAVVAEISQQLYNSQFLLALQYNQASEGTNMS